MTTFTYNGFTFPVDARIEMKLSELSTLTVTEEQYAQGFDELRDGVIHSDRPYRLVHILTNADKSVFPPRSLYVVEDPRSLKPKSD